MSRENECIVVDSTVYMIKCLQNLPNDKDHRAKVLIDLLYYELRRFHSRNDSGVRKDIRHYYTYLCSMSWVPSSRIKKLEEIRRSMKQKRMNKKLQSAYKRVDKVNAIIEKEKHD